MTLVPKYSEGDCLILQQVAAATKEMLTTVYTANKKKSVRIREQKYLKNINI